MDVPELISPVNPPDNLARRAGCKCNRRSGVSDDSHAKSCPLFHAPSTPAPLDEMPTPKPRPLHEIDKQLSGWSRGHTGIYIQKLEKALARERESRKQAEYKAFNAGIEAAAKAAGSVYEEHLKRNPLVTQLSTPQSVLDAAVRLVRALSKPVQEPAERERGK